MIKIRFLLSKYNAFKINIHIYIYTHPNLTYNASLDTLDVFTNINIDIDNAQVILKLEKDLYPHQLCDYLFDLGQNFNQFYEKCPVNQASTPALQSSRLALCKLTANTLKTSLGLLGIKTVDVL